jgi:hypothetical protein
MAQASSDRIERSRPLSFLRQPSGFRQEAMRVAMVGQQFLD